MISRNSAAAFETESGSGGQFAMPSVTFQPYISEEIFFDLRNEGFNRSRFTTGLMMRVNSFQPEVFWFWQVSEDNPSWINEFILGFRLMYFI